MDRLFFCFMENVEGLGLTKKKKCNILQNIR